MVDGILGGIGDFFGGAKDFLLGGGRYADPTAINPQYGVPEADVRQAGINTLANVSALLLAAGQPMSGAQRAQMLAGIGPAFGGMTTDIYKASQSRLMLAQQKEKMDELQEISAIHKRRQEDPAGLAKAMGISEELVKTMDARTLRDVAKQITIKRATVSPLEQAAQARVGQILGIPMPSPVPGVGTPSVSVAGVVQPTTQTQPPVPPVRPSAEIIQTQTQETTQPKTETQISPTTTEPKMTAEIARKIASDPIIMTGNPEMAKKYADLAEKLETPGMKEAQILRARTQATKMENMPKIELSIANRSQQNALVKDTIESAIKDIGFTTTGVTGRVAGMIPGTSAYDLGRKIETIKSNIGFDALQRMRDESPTGGALGQVAIQELNYLQAALGNLDTAQSPEQLKKNLVQVKSIIERYERARTNAFERDYGRKPDIQRLLRNPEEIESKAAAAGATPSQATPQQLRTDPAAIESAKKAIAAGAPAGAVRQRLRERGISDEGL